MLSAQLAAIFMDLLCNHGAVEKGTSETYAITSRKSHIPFQLFSFCVSLGLFG